LKATRRHWGENSVHHTFADKTICGIQLAMLGRGWRIGRTRKGKDVNCAVCIEAMGRLRK